MRLVPELVPELATREQRVNERVPQVDVVEIEHSADGSGSGTEQGSKDTEARATVSEDVLRR